MINTLAGFQLRGTGHLVEHNRATGNFILIDPATNATAAAGMIRRSLGEDTISAEPNQHAAVLLVADVTQANNVEQLLLVHCVAVVRTRVASRHLLQALLRIGVIVLLEGITCEAANLLAEELPIQTADISTCTPEQLLQQLQEKNILPPQKVSHQ